MLHTLTTPPGSPARTFLELPYHAPKDLEKADFAILGIPHCAPYSMSQAANDQSNAPAAVRAQSGQFCDGLDHYDFDLGGCLLDGRDIRIVDCGDVRADPADLTGNMERAIASVRLIEASGAIPIIIGGDHGATVPVLRGLEQSGPITLVHVDAHLDWRDEVNGVRDGYSSPIRRASELDYVREIHQIGMRGTGSARPEEVIAANQYGAVITTAWQLHDEGMQAVLDSIPDGGNYYLTIDADGLDPTYMPAVCAPSPGGVTYPQIRQLIHGLIAKGNMVGMDLVEIAPKFDAVNAITCISAGRLILNLIGGVTRKAAL